MQFIRHVCLVLATTTVLSFWSIPAISGDIKEGKVKSEACAGCHGADGISLSPDIPNLRGQKEQYLVIQYKAFKSGTRKSGMMSSVVEFIPENDMLDIISFYSSLSLGGTAKESLASTENAESTEN